MNISWINIIQPYILYIRYWNILNKKYSFVIKKGHFLVFSEKHQLQTETEKRKILI
jgi:hypothetical protein